MSVHSTAIIGAGAKLGQNVVVEPYAVIDSDVVIGDNSVIEAHARIRNGARIGDNCKIGSFAVIAGEPQDIHFDSSIISYVEIGSGSTIRESATIHRATVPNSSTKIGKNCFFMAGSHVGHDSVIGDNCIIANFAALAGWVEMDDNCFISGGVMLHQKIRVGEGVIVSGNSASSMDIPPYVNVAGRNDMAGLNLIGLSRRGASREAVHELKSLYARVFATLSTRKNAMEALAEGAAKTPEGLKFLKFFEIGGRHYLHPSKNQRAL